MNTTSLERDPWIKVSKMSNIKNAQRPIMEINLESDDDMTAEIHHHHHHHHHQHQQQ